MRYFLTLPFAALALAATPAMAQDTATPPEAATTQTPPTDPMAQPTTTPPAEPAAPTEPTTSAPATPASEPAAPTTGASAGLTSEQKVAYDAWPAATKSYFDALTPARQQLFLRITDNDKAKLVALPATQQESVWASLEKQAAAEPKAS